MSLIWEARTAARSLARRPLFSATAVLILGVGIGASTAVFSVFHGVLLRPLPLPEPERLVRVYKNDVERGFPHHPLRYRELRDWIEGRASLEGAAAMSSHDGWSVTLIDDGVPRTVQALPVTVGFFDVLGLEAIAGRTFSAADDRAVETPAMVLSHRFWQQAFGASPDAIGRSVRLLMGRGEHFRIVGVLPPGVEYPRGTDLYVAAFGPGADWMEYWSVECDAIVRLRPGASLGEARAELAAAYAHLVAEQPETYRAMEVVATPLLDTVVGETRKALRLLLGAVVAVLAIAALNVAGLLLVRGLDQERETAIRAALGAGRSRLIGTRLLETSMLAALGAGLGLVLARIGLDALRLWSPAGALPRADQIGLHPAVLAFALAVTAAAGGATAVLTAWQSTRTEVVCALRRGPGLLPGRRALSAVVVAELAMAFAVVVGAFLFARDLAARLAVDRGIDSEQLLIASLEIPYSRYGGESLIAFSDRLLEKVEALPGVIAATPVSVGPATGARGTGAHVMREGQSEAEAASNPMASFEAAHEGYFRTLGIPILEGRGLERRDRGNASKVVVVSESLARLIWPERSPVGQRLRFGVSLPWLTVVGVAADVRYRQLERQWHSVYWPPGQNSFDDEPGPGWYTPSALIVRSSLGAEALAGPVRRAVRELDPEIPVEHVAPVAEVLSAELARPRFQTALIALFALVAIALSAAGLYGVLAATGRQRTPEIGIRLALGATRRQAVAPVLRRGALLTATGLSLGAALSLAGSRAVEALLFGVPSLHAFSFATAAALLALVACAAAAGPIRRAARTDCAATLRGE